MSEAVVPLPPRGDAARVAELVARIGTDAAELAALVSGGGLGPVAAAALPALTRDVSDAVDGLTAVRSSMVVRLDRSGIVASQGYVSTARWLQVEAGMSRPLSWAVVARGRDLDDRYPATREAWLAGRINGEVAREISLGLSAAVDRLPADQREAARADAEPLLLHIGERYGLEHVRRAIRRLRLAAEPDGGSRSAMEAYEAQYLRLTEVGDGFEVRGFLAHEPGARVLAVLAAFVEKLRADRLLTPNAPIDPSTGLPDVTAEVPRPTGRRDAWSATALDAWARSTLAADDLPAVAGERPQLQVAVTLEDLRAGGIGQLDLPDLGRSADLAGESARRVGCDADLRPVLASGQGYDEDGRVLDPAVAALLAHGWEVLALGRRRRLVSAGQRAALVYRDRGCAFPGCAAPHHWCEAHHVEHWSAGGRTDVANLVLLCSRHHHTVHEGGWSIRVRPGSRPGRPGYFTFHPPDRRSRP